MSKTERAVTTAVMLMMVASPVLAGDQPWNQAADGVLGFLQGGVMKTIATIAIIAVGVMGFFGRLQWGVAIPIIVGFTLVFGASAFVDALSGLFK